ncbi:universal stress protein [Halomarina rubra]|uniref:Universal stress protein n=1 Tax=Halomarina rubra TaxID=2071873 RepID=A0ABD6AY33_9EURY|nr:universal stress protein [Halomarina rubra]
MNRRFVVPTDGSDRARHAFSYVVEMFPNPDVTALHVVDPVEAGYGGQTDDPGHASDWRDTEGTNADGTFEVIRDLAAEAEVTLSTRVVEGQPAEAIVAFAEEGEFDGIVMGSQGRSGVSRVLLGSVAESVVGNSSIPVTVVR